MTTDNTDNKTQAIDTVITLVHGTWANNAAWAKPDSRLYTSIKKHFGKSAKITIFNWTGKNTHSARTNAETSLAQQLNKNHDDFSHARHFVISHSHGGNIALNAVSKDDLSEKITGVACMSTPFFTARWRDMGQNPYQHIAGALVTLMFVVIMAADKLNLPDWGYGTLRAAIIIAISVGVITVFAILVIILQKHSKRIISQIKAPTVNQDKVLILRSPADEASAILTISQFISQTTVRLYLHTFRLFRSFELKAKHWSVHHKVRLTVIALLAFLSIPAWLVLGTQLDVPIIINGKLSLVFLAWMMAMILVCVSSIFLIFNWVDGATVLPRILVSMIIWPVVLVLSLLLLPFGWEIAAANLLLEVTTESTPSGKWTVNLIEPASYGDLGNSHLPLRHSMIYDDVNAIELICHWMKDSNAKPS